MSCRLRLIALLRERRAPFRLHHHPPAYTARDLAWMEHVPASDVAKTVVVKADGHDVLLVLPADHRVNFPRVAEVVGAQHVRLASEGEMAPDFPDCEIGAVPPVGELFDTPVYVDASLADDEEILFPAGTHSDTVQMRFADFAQALQPTVASFAYAA